MSAVFLISVVPAVWEPRDLATTAATEAARRRKTGLELEHNWQQLGFWDSEVMW